MNQQTLHDFLKERQNKKERDEIVDINSLPDEMLLHLSSFMDATDLYNFSRCSERVYNICTDKSLWIKVKATCNCEGFAHSHLIPYLNSSTTCIRFFKTEKSINRLKLENCRLTCDFFHTINSMIQDRCFDSNFVKFLKTSAPNLRSFILENHVISARKFQLHHLPESLTELRLQGTQISHSLEVPCFSFYNDGYNSIARILPNLKIIDVSYCQWFHSYLLQDLCYCNNLKELRMAGCRNLTNFETVWNYAVMKGLNNLEILDLQLTNVLDIPHVDIRIPKSVKHIYFEKPNNMIYANTEGELTTNIHFVMMSNHLHIVHHFCNVYHRCVCVKNNNTIETLVFRNYMSFTDTALENTKNYLKALKYLDITSCNCTAEQVTIFKTSRPKVKLLCDGIVH